MERSAPVAGQAPPGLASLQLSPVSPRQATSYSWTPRTPRPGAPGPTCSPSPRRQQPLRSVSPSGTTSTGPRSVSDPGAGRGLPSLSLQSPRGEVGSHQEWGSGPLLPSPASRDTAPGSEAGRRGRNAPVVADRHPRQPLARGLGHPAPPAGLWHQVPSEAPRLGGGGGQGPQLLTPSAPSCCSRASGTATTAPWRWTTWPCGLGPAGPPGGAPLRTRTVASPAGAKASGHARPMPRATPPGAPALTTPQRRPRVCDRGEEWGGRGSQMQADIGTSQGTTWWWTRAHRPCLVATWPP